MEEIVQLNVRMPRDLRDAGNGALLTSGVSPSALVRAIWERLSHRGKDLQDVLDLLAPLENAEESERTTCATLAQGQQLYEGVLSTAGVSRQTARTALASREYQTQLEDALMDRWHERGLDHA